MIERVSSGGPHLQLNKRRFSAILLLMVFCATSASACMRPAPPLREAIVGKWSNAQGGVISFSADGTGVVPAAADLPAYNFTYSIPDEQHLQINVDGQDLTVGIKIDGDTMTWRNSLNNTAFVYTRMK